MRRTVATAVLTTLMVIVGIPTHGRARPGVRIQRPVVQKPAVEDPRFEDFPVTEQFKGRPAPARLVTREARKYRTMIRDAASDGPNFAGRYALAQWGCGAGCVQFAIVDAKTGIVFMPSFYVGPRAFKEGQTGEPDETLQFRLDSKLLIVNGSRNEKCEGLYYYRWDGKRLVLIKAVDSVSGPGA